MTPQTPAAEIPLGDDERLLIEAAEGGPSMLRGTLRAPRRSRVRVRRAPRSGPRLRRKISPPRSFTTRSRTWAASSGAAFRSRPGSSRSRGIPSPIAGSAGRASGECRRPIRPTTSARRTRTDEQCWRTSVRRLPGDQQRVVLERFVEDKSIREIAHELGRTEGAVKQLQFRALETLRARMKGMSDE